MAVKWNLKDIGRRLRPEAIFDLTKGGNKAKTMQRRLTGSMVAGGTGYLTGNKLGGAAGGIWGYNEGNEPITGRNMGQQALRGVLAGGIMRGLGKAGSYLTSGSGAGSGSSAPAVAGAEEAGKGALWKSLLGNAVSGAFSGGGGGQAPEEYDYNKMLDLYRSRYSVM